MGKIYKLYGITNDNLIVVIESICHCPECVKRGMYEAELNLLDGTYYSCPCCGYLIDKFCIMQDNNYKKIVITTSSYCSKCGQAIDWSDE